MVRPSTPFVLLLRAAKGLEAFGAWMFKCGDTPTSTPKTHLLPGILSALKLPGQMLRLKGFTRSQKSGDIWKLVVDIWVLAGLHP